MTEKQINEGEQAIALQKTIPKRLSKQKSWLWLLLLLVLTISIASLLVSYQFKRKENQSFKQQQNLLQNYIRSNSEQVAQLQRNIAALQSQALQQQALLKQQQASLQELIQHSHYTEVDWVLAEIQYSLRIANLKLRYNQDGAAAAALLQIAYQQLQSLQEPQLLLIQQMLANHITVLQNIAINNIEEVLIRITALSQQISQLPLITPRLATEENVANHSLAEQWKAGWRQALHASLASLKKLVIIRRNDQPITPLLAPEQRFYLEQNLLLILDKAQTAALHGQNQLYQANLQLASDWVKHYFANNAIVTQNMLASLAKLRTININPNWPDLTKLIDSLNQYREKRHKNTL